MRYDRRGVLVGMTAFVVWGFLTVYWKALHGFDAFELIGHRIVWASVLLAVTLMGTRRLGALTTALRTPRIAFFLGLASLLLAVNWTSYVYAVVHGRVVETALGYFIAPIGTMLLGVFAYHEALSPARLVGFALVWAALGIITLDSLTAGRSTSPELALVS